MIQLRVALVAITLFASANSTMATETSGSNTAPNSDAIAASVYRGKMLFKHYCVLCHGVKADGNGRAAKLYQPRPANLVTSDKNTQYKELIIRKGGAAIGRSKDMPAWDGELNNEQIKDVVSFLNSISSTPKK